MQACHISLRYAQHIRIPPHHAVCGKPGIAVGCAPSSTPGISERPAVGLTRAASDVAAMSSCECKNGPSQHCSDKANGGSDCRAVHLLAALAFSGQSAIDQLLKLDLLTTVTSLLQAYVQQLQHNQADQAVSEESPQDNRAQSVDDSLPVDAANTPATEDTASAALQLLQVNCNRAGSGALLALSTAFPPS